MIDDVICELAPMVGVAAACAAVGRPRATHYRWHRKSPLPAKRVRVAAAQPRALDAVERKEVLRVLHEPGHVDEAPATVYAKLLAPILHVVWVVEVLGCAKTPSW
jgi:putative transposase